MNPIVLSKHLENSASSGKWKRIGVKKRAGVLAPLFSIYSRNSIGIGDLDDLRLLVDWAVESGNSIIQLLPLNEVGALFCPYDSLSSFALEPAYLSLEKVPQSNNPRIKKKILQLRKEFPTGRGFVDYRIKKAKLDLLWEIFLEEDSRVGKDFKQFIAMNSYWLEDFTLFKALKESFGGRAWYEWEEKYKKRNPQALDNFKKEQQKKISFEAWLQWHLSKQLKEARRYAAAKKILLKGDLPILVSRDSADVWAHPEFFKLEFAAGAPPDMYCAKGQRWGMPTYNWGRIAADNYRYLIAKLNYAQEFYDILRIDHVVGLFRIWSISEQEPMDNQGLNGFFDPKEEGKWGGHGRSILSTMLDNTTMLLCAEDLGVIPQVCTDALKEFGIPGNDVQRWVKDWKAKHDFLPSEDYRELSVAMLSTHDTTNWPAWWENEAGTVDEGLFARKCSDHRHIGFTRVKDQLFDSSRSGHGRLRWRDDIDSVDKLIGILGKKKEDLADFIDLYLNSYQEKEKLWKHLGLSGPMREKSDSEIMNGALKISLESNAIFSINTLVDWLYPSGIFRGDPYQYRINTPGTISERNWSLNLPISLEELLRDKVTVGIRRKISASGRWK